MNLRRKLLFAGMGLFYTILQLHAQPLITNQPASQTNLPGASVTFNVGVNGAGTFTYQWQFNGTNLPNNIISTVAGGGSGGDGYAATNASLGPFAVTFDAFGNLFIADSGNNRIRKVNANGIITTVAGNGIGTYAGDGGAATNASLSQPYGVAFDASGTLYIADSNNGRVRKVDTNGIITTVAGGGSGGDGDAATNASISGPFAVTFDAYGNLFIADSGNNRIRKVDTNGIITTVAGNGTATYAGDGGAATNASLFWPRSVTFDAYGNLFITDSDNNCIRKVDTNGIITTVVGNGNRTYSGDGGAATNASLWFPQGLAFDVYGNLYIADYLDPRIRKVDVNSIITTVAGSGSYGYSGDGGAATNASLYYPSGVASDTSGNMYFADSGNGRIRKVLLYAGNPTLTLNNIGATNGGNYTVAITSPNGSVTSVVATLTVAAPAVITVQPTNQLVVPGNSPSFSVVVAGSGPFDYEWYFAGTNLVQSGTNNTLTLPNISTNNAGNYMVVVTNNYGSVTSQVAVLTVALPPLLTTQPANQTNIAGTTVTFNAGVYGIGPFTYQWQFNGTNLPNNIITTVAGNGQSFPPNAGGYNGDGIPATYASFFNPSGVAFDGFGNLFIADTSNNRIRKVDTHGVITTVAGNGSATYAGDGSAATSASLYSPGGVGFDAFGNLYIADQRNIRIRKVDTNGIITTVAGNGSAAYAGDGGAATNASLKLLTPSASAGVAFDACGNLFIADAGNNRIRKVDTNGIITTVAGGGSGGDGGAATNANLSKPSGVAFGDSCSLYIADYGNNRIRMVDTNGIITTVAGGGSGGDGGAATNASLSKPSGVAFGASGYLYIADSGNNRIRQMDTNGIITTVAGNGSATYAGDGGAATNASLKLLNPNASAGVAFDACGNLFIADPGNNRIREVFLYAGYPTLTLNKIGVADAGNYSVVVTSPYGSVTSMVATLTLATPAIITSQPASQIVAVGGSPGFSVAVAGSGPFGYEWYFATTNLVQSGTNNTLMLPNVSTNNAGNYTVVVTNNYGSVTSHIATLSVLLPIQPGSLTNLAGTTVTLNAGVNDSGPFSYQWQFNGTNLPNNIITTVAGGGAGGGADGLGDGGVATDASLNNPVGVAFDANGNLFIADFYFGRVRMLDAKGIISTAVGGGTNGPGDGGAATNASIYRPQGVAFDTFGNLFVADSFSYRIRKVDTNGIITTMAGNGSSGFSGDGGAATNASFDAPFGAVCDALGNLFIADTYNHRIRKVDTNGIITNAAGRGPVGSIFNGSYSGDGGAATSANLNNPQDVAFDAFGNLFIADELNSRIRRVDTNGIITTVAGNGSATYAGDGGLATSASLRFPTGVAFDAYGNLFIADYNNQRIRKVDTHGIITTVAGNGSATYAGDGGAASNASLDQPQRVACDAYGNVYIGDSLNNRVREVHLAGYPTLTLNNIGVTNAGNYTVVIFSPYGSITSLVATLTVIVPPQIIASGTNFGFTTNLANQSGFGFNISGTVGQTIVVDGSTNLLNWTPLHTNTANGIPVYFFDPTSTNFPGRFYRARLPQ